MKFIADVIISAYTLLTWLNHAWGHSDSTHFKKWHYAEATVTTPLDKWLVCSTK